MAQERSTRQRKAIEDALTRADRPMTPEELLVLAQGEVPKLGIATVYRAIKDLRDAGEVVAVEVPGHPTCYESAHRGHHHHFHCRVCHRVFEVGAGAPRSGLGLGLAGGATWAATESLAIDGEVFAAAHRATFDQSGGGVATGFNGEGMLQRYGARMRLLWTPAPRWSLGVEAGWVQWSTELAGDAERSLTLDGGGPAAAVAFCWRPSARPGSVE